MGHYRILPPEGETSHHGKNLYVWTNRIFRDTQVPPALLPYLAHGDLWHFSNHFSACSHPTGQEPPCCLLLGLLPISLYATLNQNHLTSTFTRPQR